MSVRWQRIATTCLSAAVIVCSCAAAGAAEYTWSGSGSFNDPANWTPAGGPPGTADTATFTVPHGFGDVMVPQATTVGGVNVLNVGGPFDIGPGGLRVVGTSSTAFRVESVANQTVSVRISRGTFEVPDGGVRVLDPTPYDTRSSSRLRAGRPSRPTGCRSSVATCTSGAPWASACRAR